MRRWTLLEIKNKIKRDLDLEAEDFIQDSELLDIINEGVDDCEAHIHRLGREDEYFLASHTINLVQGTSEYAMPSDIYANKIKAVTFVQGATIFPIKRLRSEHRFTDIEIINNFSQGDDYRYLVVNENVADGYRLKLFPPSRVTLTSGLKIWHIRDANRLSVDDDICDIPEFVYYVIAFAKYQIYYKEGNPNVAEAKAEMDRQKMLMLETLAEMIDDEDNELIKDFSHYDASN